jgi:hypothetical protein
MPVPLGLNGGMQDYRKGDVYQQTFEQSRIKQRALFALSGLFTSRKFNLNA